MCNRYASDIRKAGLEREFYGFDEWSDTRINPVLGKAVLEVFPKSVGPIIPMGSSGGLEWARKGRAWDFGRGPLDPKSGPTPCSAPKRT